MATLHLVNKHSASDALQACARVVQPPDAVLLLEDGVYAALPGAGADTLLHTCSKGRCVALAADVEARGLGARLAPGIGVVDYAGFVELTVACDRVMSWF